LIEINFIIFGIVGLNVDRLGVKDNKTGKDKKPKDQSPTSTNFQITNW